MPEQPKINFPMVTDDSVRGFAQVWDYKGLKMILDNTSIQFAKDFANTALRSYHIDLLNKAIQAKKAREAAQANPAVPEQAYSAPVKSSIILTDGN